MRTFVKGKFGDKQIGTETEAGGKFLYFFLSEKYVLNNFRDEK